MIKQTATIVFSGLLFAAPLGGTVLAQSNSGSFFGQVAGSGYGGGRIEVCRATGSQFTPYVKVSVPRQIADRWISSGQAINPDAQGQCPKGVSIRDFVREILANVFSRFA